MGAVGVMYMNVYYIVFLLLHSFKSIASVASSYDVSKSSPTRSTEENTFW